MIIMRIFNNKKVVGLYMTISPQQIHSFNVNHPITVISICWTCFGVHVRI